MVNTLIAEQDHQLVPWKNGLGMTREVANAHGTNGTMLWRISLATVDRDGPFSDFAGYKRIIMLLEGKGMTLDFGVHGSAVMDTPFVPVAFDGAWPTSATLHDGPTRDLNVVTSAERASGAVALLEPAKATADLAPSHGVTVLYVLRGTAEARVGGERWAMAAGEALRLDGAGQTGTLAGNGKDTLVYRIDIDLA
jgi:uncharacterized protein